MQKVKKLLKNAKQSALLAQVLLKFLASSYWPRTYKYSALKRTMYSGFKFCFNFKWAIYILRYIVVATRNSFFAKCLQNNNKNNNNNKTSSRECLSILYRSLKCFLCYN